MKRPDDTLLTKTADGLTRCPRCRRHVLAGDTPRDRRCPFCVKGAAPRFGVRGGMVAASLMGLGACGPSAEELARVEAEQQAQAQQLEESRRLAAEAEARAAAEALERARALEVAAAEAAAKEAEERAAAEAAAAAAAAAAAEEAQPRARRRRAPDEPGYTPMGPDRAPAVTYGLDF